MKKLAWALLVAAAAVAVQPPMWARVYYNDAAVAERDIVGAGMDVVSGSASEKYYDVIAPESDLAALQGEGYRVKVLAADADKPIRDLPADLGLYHTYAEMLTELQSYAATYPSICQLTDIGDTWEARNIWCLKISDNPGTSENEPRLYVCGDHHARELMTVEIPLHFIKTLLEGYATNTNYQYYINNYEMYFVPMVNPDGHVYVEGHSSGSPSSWWRKNRRVNTGGSYGVDLNRNYGYKWGYDNTGSSGTPSSDTYRGPSAFS
jgi:carboxypeptidase T